MYLFQNYNCEICLSTFPKYLIIKNKKVILLDIDLSNYKSYAICDLIQYDESNDYIFHIGFLVLRLEEGVPLKIGRKKENNVVFKDLSISGNHCEILPKNHRLYIKDSGSKFGTMYYIQNEQEMNLDETLYLIYEKYKFEIRLIRKESFLCDFGIPEFIRNLFEYKCCGDKNKDKGDYDVINNIGYNGNNIINSQNIDNVYENKMSIERIKYFERFEDCDFYNDFVINMDVSEKQNSQNKDDSE